MKKHFKYLLFAVAFVAASTIVKAQPPNWLTYGNTGAPNFKLGNTSNHDLKVITNNTTRLIIKKVDGKVGIGTNAPLSPASQLQVDVTIPEDGIRIVQNGANGVNGAAGLHLKNNTAGGKMWSLYSLGQGNGIEGSGNFLIQEADDYHVSPISRMIIQKSTGNVGIGTVTPTENLVLSEPAGNLAGTQNFLLVETVINPFVPSTQGVLIRKDDGQKRGFKLFQDGSDDANSVFKIASFSASSDIDRLTIKRDNGNVGIGTNAPTAKLSVNGTANNTTGAWGVFSDSRVKKAIADFTDGLNVIKQIRTIKFNYNENAPFKAEGEQIGVVAQELEKVAPYMVSKKAMGDMKDLREVNNQAYPFLLINAVKELAAENEELKAQLLAMNARLEALENGKNLSAQNSQQTIIKSSGAHLYQIAPNPFSQKATISFKLFPAVANAQLSITNPAGKTLKTYSLAAGATQQDVYANNFASGIYHYSLIVNGKVVDSKQMVITK